MDVILTSNDYLMENCSDPSVNVAPVSNSYLAPPKNKAASFVQAPVLGMTRVTNAILNYAVSFSQNEFVRKASVASRRGNGDVNVLKQRDLLRTGMILLALINC